jgi:hypothetical protein
VIAETASTACCVIVQDESHDNSGLDARHAQTASLLPAAYHYLGASERLSQYFGG